MSPSFFLGFRIPKAQDAQAIYVGNSNPKIVKAATRLLDLAQIANMSPSAFHQHFKSITSMTPVQFQKALRLQEARSLMINKVMDVSRASYEVGYSSVSQFSREYSLHFGKSPTKDVADARG